MANHPDNENASGELYGETLEQYTAALENTKVVIVAKSTCGYCRRAEGLLRTASQDVVVFNVDHAAEGPAVLAAAQEATESKTVPIIFFDGRYVGGCDDIVGMRARGELYQQLGAPPPPRATWMPASSEDRRDTQMRQALFYFPHTVNLNVIQAIALQIFTLGIIVCVFYERTWAAWLALAMCADFIVRVIGGGMFSPIGAFAMVVTSPFKERLGNGVSKQFAACIGVVFSLISGMLLINGNKVAGLVVMAMLCGAASLEGFFGFCLGCWFFGHMVNFGLINSNVYDVHIDQRPNFQAFIDFVDDFVTPLREIEKMQLRQPGQPATLADKRMKVNKSDDHVRRSWNPLKYIQLADFIIPLCFAGLALAFKLQRTDYYNEDSLWHFFAYFSLGLFITMSVVMLGKCVAFPRKVWGEIIHPMKSNFVVAWPILLVIYSYLYDTHGSDSAMGFKKFLFWTGAALLKLMLVWKVSQLVGTRGSDEVITPGLLLPIGGCMLAATTATVFKGYLEVGWFLFGLPALLSVLLVGSTFYHSVTYHWSDERVRVQLALWPTVIHIAFLAYVFLTATSYGAVPAAADVTRLDAFAHVLFYSGVTMCLVLFWLAVPMGFLIRLKFDMSFWILGFVADILAVACLVFDAAIHASDDLRYLGEYLSIGSLFLACWVNLTLLWLTVFWAVKRRWPRAAYKWAPQSFNKLTHEALRASAAHLQNSAKYYKSLVGHIADEQLQTFATDLAKELEVHLLVLDWHSMMEDDVLFRYVDSFSPLLSMDGYRQHHALHQMEAKAAAVVQKLLHEGYPAAEGLGELEAILDIMTPYAAEHMDWEEDKLNGVLRKDVNLSVQKQMMQTLWYRYLARSMEEIRGQKTPGDNGRWDEYDLTKLGNTFDKCAYPLLADTSAYMGFPPQHPDCPMPPAKQQIMRVMLPWVVNNLMYPMQRARYVKAIIWAVPEMAQQIGDMVYRGVPETTWACIATDVPECVPRGLPGWSRRI